jgi:glycosyltransferase involved in cell wall biosynthesis
MIHAVTEPMTAHRRLLISAFGIHMGGGLVLLKALLSASTMQTREVLIDSRIASSLGNVRCGVETQAVSRSLWQRLLALTQLARRAKSTDTLLCFNSLPPLVRSKAFVVTYVQAPHFVGAHAGISYPPLTRLRLAIERLWFDRGLRFSNELWVQTRTMADALLASNPECTVRVVPLVDQTLSTALRELSDVRDRPDERQLSFFYPADGVGHKNHERLVLAWKQLVQSDMAPKLSLTLHPHEFVRVAAKTGVSMADLPCVENLGRISREEVLAEMSRSSALIFPSLAETFGLPLLEARMLGKPILAAERDFIRDVCSPAETFDPESPRSIANAVRRFIHGGDEMASQFFSPSEFVERLLPEAN